MCLPQGHNTVTPVRLEPAAPRSWVKHSITEPLGSLAKGDVTFLICIHSRLTLPLAIVVICNSKCIAATNISHWLKIHSRWFKNYIYAKKCILISFWIFQYCFYYSFTLYYCAILNSLDAGFFSVPSGCQTDWIQIRPNILSGLILVKTVCIGHQQMASHR